MCRTHEIAYLQSPKLTCVELGHACFPSVPVGHRNPHQPCGVQPWLSGTDAPQSEVGSACADSRHLSIGRGTKEPADSYEPDKMFLRKMYPHVTWNWCPGGCPAMPRIWTSFPHQPQDLQYDVEWWGDREVTLLTTTLIGGSGCAGGGICSWNQGHRGCDRGFLGK